MLNVAEVNRFGRRDREAPLALILVAAFGNVRWGKLAGLRRRNLDLNNSDSVGVSRSTRQ